MSTFKDLKLIEPILRAIKDKGYEQPTSIQEKSVPIILNRQDLLGIAQTGTGKTAAFAIPMIQLIHQIDKQKYSQVKLRALILTPTRELAIQIEQNIQTYNKYTNIRHAVIFGGVKPASQISALKKGIQLLVATPGRLLDLMNQGYIDLSEIKMFVLDEADRMLDMGFIHDINRVVKVLPKKRQTLFFSATMPANIITLSQKLLYKPTKIEIAPSFKPTENVSQSLYYTNKKDKPGLLVHILKKHDIRQALIFTRTKYGADKLTRKIKKQQFNAMAIHGNKSQNQRQKALESFKNGKTNFLIATDIAARGIDVKKLKHVVNFNIPNIPETYIHRIGRSGRAGEKGFAISICQSDERPYVKAIEKHTNKTLEIIKNHPFPESDDPVEEKTGKDYNKISKARKNKQFFNKRRKKNPKAHRTKN